jgi:hypothetical protein
MNEPRNEYQTRMDNLMKEVSKIFEGNDAVETAQVAAAACAWAIYSAGTSEGHREKLFAAMVELMRHELEKFVRNPTLTLQ